MHREYDLSGVRVLVAEDSEFMRALMADILTELSVGKVTTASDGETAKTLIEKAANSQDDLQPFDLIFSDWAMKPLDGFKLLEWVRKHPNTDIRFIPFIMVSAYSTLEWVTMARDAGVTEFLTKPVSVKTIVARLGSVIEKPRAFVKSSKYFGPDRRRRDAPIDHPNRRRG
jgi:two-component system, chemotaxis family, chemotaxis protein CheY